MSNPILAVCLDCGDTLVDEGTEIKDENQVTQRAELIPGAAQMVAGIQERGIPIALVADGPAGTFHNVLHQHDLWRFFDAFAISGQVGVSKPDPRMFRHALEQLGIEKADYGRVIMVGNNLERDIKGANALGLISVWLSWSTRRTHTPADASEIPQFTIATPLDFLPILDQMNNT